MFKSRMTSLFCVLSISWGVGASALAERNNGNEDFCNYSDQDRQRHVMDSYWFAYERRPSSDEYYGWMDKLRRREVGCSAFTRIIYIHATYMIGYNRGNTPAEYREHDLAIYNGYQTYQQMRAEVLGRAVYITKCRREPSLDELVRAQETVLYGGSTIAAYHRALNEARCGYGRGNR